MIDITFLTLFIVFLICSFAYLFFKEKDIWLQMLFAMCLFALVIQLVPLVYWQTEFDMGYPIVEGKILLDDMDLDNLNIVDFETLSSPTTYYVHRFANVDKKDEDLFYDVNFCFMYNNTDDANVVKVSTSVNEISDFFYIDENSSGTACVHINKSVVHNNAYIGLFCPDCSVPNPLLIPHDNNSVPVQEVHITNSNPLSYTLENEAPHIFWLEYTMLPYAQIRQHYWYFLWTIGLFAPLFLFRLIFNFIKGGQNDLED